MRARTGPPVRSAPRRATAPHRGTTDVRSRADAASVTETRPIRIDSGAEAMRSITSVPADVTVHITASQRNDRTRQRSPHSALCPFVAAAGPDEELPHRSGRRRCTVASTPIDTGLQTRSITAPETILEMRSITKEFPGVKALSEVSLNVRAGEIHAICGENGAGKSTLMKVLSGVYPYGTYTGEIVFEGEEVRFANIKQSEQAGIVIIHQELALIPELSITENLFLGQRAGPLRHHRLDRRAAACAGPARPRRPARRPGHADQEHRRRQAAARGDREGAAQGRQAAHPRRAHRGPERERLAAPARPDRRAEGQGHLEHHHQPQAQRDRADRGRDHDHPRRQDHRDAQRQGGRRQRGPDHPRDGRPIARVPVPGPHPEDRRDVLRGPRLDRAAPARLLAPGLQGLELPREARRDRRVRRSDGRRTHRAGDEPVRPLLRHLPRWPGHQGRPGDQAQQRAAGHRRRHRLRLRGPQGARPEPARHRQALHRRGRPQEDLEGRRRRLARGVLGRREVPQDAPHEGADVSRTTSASSPAGTSRRSSCRSGCSPTPTC